MINELKIIAVRVKNRYPWLIAGELSMALQGAMIYAKEIKIYTTRVGAYDFPKILKDLASVPIKPVKSKHLTYFEGKFMLNNIPVVIIGDPIIQTELMELPLPIQELYQNPVYESFGDVNIPLLPIEWCIFLEIIRGVDKEKWKKIFIPSVKKDDIFKIAKRFGLENYIREKIPK